jgi:uncharacterized phage protein gp47/JayE
MAFTVRTRSEIRDQLLSYWSAEYALRGETLLTSAGSDAYLLASQIGVVQEALDAQASQIARDILPDQASSTSLARFGEVYGIARPAGTDATLAAQVTAAAPLTTYAIPDGTLLAYTDGSLYLVSSTSITTDGASHATILATSTTIGSASSRSVGDVLTFQTAPAGLNPTATVTTAVAGTNAATDDVYRALIVARLQERPASGNRADWQAWVSGYRGTSIVDAYIYPLLQPPASNPGNGTANVLGCVTVVAVGPAQGDSTTNTRIVPADDVSTRVAGGPLLRVIDYVEGTRTADGTPTATGVQLRPVTMGAADYTIQTINVQSQNVQLALTVTTANAFPFVSSPGVSATSTSTALIVSGNYGAGGLEDLSGLSALVFIGTASIRGGYEQVTLGTGTYNGGTGFTTFPVALSHAPVTPSFVYAAPPCWAAVRSAVFAYFDSLAPSDSSPASRWPSEDASGDRSTLYLSALAGAITRVDGVLSCTVTTPAVNTSPSTWKTVLTLGSLLVTP